MWSAVIAGLAIFGLIVYMQGPIVALALAAAGSLALLVAMRIGERTTAAHSPARTPLQVISGKDEKDLLFPPLKQKAS